MGGWHLPWIFVKKILKQPTMKTKKFLSVFVLLAFITLSLPAQTTPRLRLGIDFGYKGDLYKLNDPAGGLKNDVIPGGYFGISLSRDLNDHFLLETGARHVQYWEGIHFKGLPAYGSATNAINSWQIPFLVKYRLHTRNDRFSLTPSAGYVMGINTDKAKDFPPDWLQREGSGSIGDGENTYHYAYQGYYNYHRIISLFEAGLSFDYRTRWGLQLSLGGAWQGGFYKIMQQDVTYSVNDGPEHEATYTSNGNNFRITLGASYALSRLWQERPDEEGRQAIREKVNNLSAARFYIGTEIGGIWNYFSHDNPDIYTEGAWNDLSLGVYGGMHLFSGFWLETGFYTERFTNDYLVSHNGSFVDGGGFERGGTGFMMIPLRLKYRLFPGHGRFSLTASLGGSVLTHTQGTGIYYDDNSFHVSADTTWEVTTAYRLKKAVFLLDAGAGLEYSLFPRLIITLNGNYYQGFTDINRLHIYRKENGEIKEGNIYYNGSHFTLSAGIRIPFGR